MAISASGLFDQILASAFFKIGERVSPLLELVRQNVSHARVVRASSSSSSC